MIAPKSALAAVVTALTLFIAGCTAPDAEGNREEVPAPEFQAGVSHVHAIDLDEMTGLVHIATHEGILLAGMPHDGETVSEANRLGDWRGDAMGLVRVGDRLLVAGHPGPTEEGPGAIGLRESDLSGDEWTAISLEGEADFHSLAAGGTSPGMAMLAGVDSISGRVMVSPHGGAGWQQGAAIAAASVAWNADASALLATTSNGLVVSRDRGQSFEAVPDAPYLVLLASSPTESDTFTMVGVDVQGVLHRSSDGLTWEAVGAVPLEPAAISVGAMGAIIVADTAQVMHSVDGGTTWNLIVEL